MQTNSYFMPEVLCVLYSQLSVFFYSFTQRRLNDYDMLLLGNNNLGKSVSLGRTFIMPSSFPVQIVLSISVAKSIFISSLVTLVSVPLK